jgi:hypothetical protein
VRTTLLALVAVALLAGSAQAEAAAPQTCAGKLKRAGVGFTTAPPRAGVAHPVRVQIPLGGISYFAAGALRPEKRMFMDCRLALALKRMAPTLRARGIVAVEHYGIYEYRCIAGTNPCVLSQHAHATAIDLHEFRAKSGRAYNVESDWVIDPDSEPTCTAPTQTAKDRFLHELICEWRRLGLFKIILTPNYNAEHRNHVHVDLTPGGDYIN